jgi:peptidoglycan hydrolase-like protein with peptidoglycan-binding domain
VSFASRALGVLTIPAIALPLGMTTASTAHAGTVAPPSKKLPSGLDVAPPYQGQKVCDPTPKAGVLAFGRLMTSHYGVGTTAWGISRGCNSGVTEHSEGRAWDWMLNVKNPREKGIADSVTRWLSAPDAHGRPGAMARRFGINYIIWNRKIWRAYDPGRGWAKYTGSSPHTDHIHFTFTWDGAHKRTSWWTGRPLTTVDPGPKPTPPKTYPTLRQGSSGADVALAQRVIGVTADGQFGPLTLAALTGWQRANRVPVTGVLDQATWAKMVALRKVPARSGTSAATQAPTATPSAGSSLSAYYATTVRRGSRGAAVVALQRALRVAADGDFGPVTERAVKAFQKSHGLAATGVVSGTTWRALAGDRPAAAANSTGGSTPPASSRPASSTPSAVTTPYTALKQTTLRIGSRGSAVKTLQRALGGLAVDGAFGQRTARAVAAFQRAHHLKATGVVTTSVWAALEMRDYPLLPYRATVLRIGSRGPAVMALQKALGIPADGHFGPQTQAAVKAAQGRAHLARTGVVAARTWAAIERAMRR